MRYFLDASIQKDLFIDGQNFPESLLIGEFVGLWHNGVDVVEEVELVVVEEVLALVPLAFRNCLIPYITQLDPYPDVSKSLVQ